MTACRPTECLGGSRSAGSAPIVCAPPDCPQAPDPVASREHRRRDSRRKVFDNLPGHPRPARPPAGLAPATSPHPLAPTARPRQELRFSNDSRECDDLLSARILRSVKTALDSGGSVG